MDADFYGIHSAIAEKSDYVQQFFRTDEFATEIKEIGVQVFVPGKEIEEGSRLRESGIQKVIRVPAIALKLSINPAARTAFIARFILDQKHHRPLGIAF